ncbi:MAG: hypothetical protein IT496_07455 [Gammaproteobacteria bacterium]|nr:hypothetical protein [Gammaproteobacteria bacterium]
MSARHCRNGIAALAASLAVADAAAAAEDEPAREQPKILNQVDIIGDPGEFCAIPGSAHCPDETVDTAAGRLDYLFAGFPRSTDGFRTIDAAPGCNETDETGFHTVEPMVRLVPEPTTAIFQRLEFKYGFSDMEADETCPGPSTGDFRHDPSRRYCVARLGNIDTGQHPTCLRHFISPAADFDRVATAYCNRFARIRYKLDDIRAAALAAAPPPRLDGAEACYPPCDPSACAAASPRRSAPVRLTGIQTVRTGHAYGTG